MEQLEKLKELYLKNLQGSVLHCDYLVEKSKRNDTDDDEMDKATITTKNMDRHGHIVITSGGNISHFMQNPTVLFAHGHDPVHGSLPIGRATDIEVKRDSMVAQWKWATDEMNPRAAMVKAQWRANFLNATSIGFIPIEVEEIESEDPEKKWWPDLRIKKWELIEFSVVATPSNRESLRKSLELQLLPFLEKMANDQKHLTAMVTELHTMLQASQPVDVVKQWRDNQTLPTNLSTYVSLEGKNVYLESKGFTFEEKFTVLHKSGCKVEELIEFYSIKSPSVVPVTAPAKSENFTVTEMAELQTLLTSFTN